MNQDTLLYTLPQWIVFTAIMVIVYGWVENKKVFRMIGSALFIGLGIFAIWVLAGDAFAGRDYLSEEEIMRLELDDETYDGLPFLAQLMPAYWSFIAASLFAIPSLILDWKDRKRIMLFHVLAGLTSLLGFFAIVSALKAL